MGMQGHYASSNTHSHQEAIHFPPENPEKPTWTLKNLAQTNWKDRIEPGALDLWISNKTHHVALV